MRGSHLKVIRIDAGFVQRLPESRPGLEVMLVGQSGGYGFLFRTERLPFSTCIKGGQNRAKSNPNLLRYDI